MTLESISTRRLVGDTLLALIAVLGFDFLLHGGILARLYAEPHPFLLSPEDAFRLIPLGYLSFLLFVILLVWLLVRLKIRGWSAGLLFGLKVGGLIWASVALGLLTISTASPTLMLGWFVGQTLEAGLAGMVAAEGLVTARPGRLIANVVGFIVVVFIVTLILQATGLAPAARVVETLPAG